MTETQQLDAVIEEIKDELLTYPGYTHGRHPAYQVGCRGLLCKRYQRDKQKTVYARDREGVKTYKPRPQIEQLNQLIDEACKLLGVDYGV